MNTPSNKRADLRCPQQGILLRGVELLRGGQLSVSAVVMLWSVVICDLLFKLQHLVDLYGDDKTKTVLAWIGKLQQANERSSE